MNSKCREKLVNGSDLSRLRLGSLSKSSLALHQFWLGKASGSGREGLLWSFLVVSLQAQKKVNSRSGCGAERSFGGEGLVGDSGPPLFSERRDLKTRPSCSLLPTPALSQGGLEGQEGFGGELESGQSKVPGKESQCLYFNPPLPLQTELSFMHCRSTTPGAAVREVNGLSDMAFPKWTSQKQLHMVPCNERVLDLIDSVYGLHHKSLNLSESAKASQLVQPCSLIVDITQSLARKVFSTSVRSMCSHSQYYSYELDRLLLPVEHYALLGWKLSDIEVGFLTGAQQRDLAGESMAVPCVGLACAALALSLPLEDLWKQPLTS